MLAEIERGRRNRRTIDSVFLLVAAVVIGLAAVIAASAAENDADVAEALDAVFGWAGALWRAAFVAVLGLAVVVVVDVLLRRRWDLARDLLVAARLRRGRDASSVGSSSPTGLPSRPSAVALGLPRAEARSGDRGARRRRPGARPPVRVLATWLVPLAALGAVVLGAALPSGGLAALALGLAAGALVRLAFGTAAGVPPSATCAALGHLGVEVGDCSLAAAADRLGRIRRPRPRRATAEGAGARSRRAGHAAAGPPVAARWHTATRRGARVGRLEQVEHEALATLMAAQAGVRVPKS